MLQTIISEKPWLLALVMAIALVVAIPVIFPLLASQEATITTRANGECIEEVWEMPLGYRADNADHREVIENMRTEGKQPTHTMPCMEQVVAPR